MAKQLSFFESTNHDGNTTVAPSRRTDPATSKQAGESVDVSGNERLFLETLLKIGYSASAYYVAAQAVAYTADESNDVTASRRETVRKRPTGLIKKGCIRNVGTSHCGYKHKDLTKYEITPKGKEALRCQKP